MWVTCANYRQGFHLASEGKATAGKPVASLQGHDSVSKGFFILEETKSQIYSVIKTRRKPSWYHKCDEKMVAVFYHVVSQKLLMVVVIVSITWSCSSLLPVLPWQQLLQQCCELVWTGAFPGWRQHNKSLIHCSQCHSTDSSAKSAAECCGWKEGQDA